MGCSPGDMIVRGTCLGEDLNCPGGEDLNCPGGEDLNCPDGEDLNCPRGEDLNCTGGEDLNLGGGTVVASTLGNPTPVLLSAAGR